MASLTERKNVFVMADEAHRTQYGFNAKYDDRGEGIKYGYTKYLRDALPSNIRWIYRHTSFNG